MRSLDLLWKSSLTNHPLTLDWESLSVQARKYAKHALPKEINQSTVLKLTMKGEIKLKNWMPFTATQVVRHEVGFVWAAKAKVGPVFVSGHDQFLNGAGEMRWKLLGLISVMHASGKDISRSAADRFAIERVLLPSSLCTEVSRWSGDESHVTIETPGYSPISLSYEPSGRISAISMLRWGSPDGGEFGLFPFGGFVDEETTWNGYTIPSKLRLGWHFGTDRFEEGEFFRATITHAEFK